jgi:serine/threonine protein kinase
MVEAINEESAIPMAGFDDREEKKDLIPVLFKRCVASSTYDSSTTTDRKYTQGPATLFDMINYALSEKTIAAQVVEKLQELGLTQYDKKLGEGAFGVVLKLHGENKNAVALKLEKRPISIANENKELAGDALGLKLPCGQHLGIATGLLTYHEGKVHYIENYDPEIHSKHLLVGVISKAIDGVPLWNRVHIAPLDSEAVKGYGKRLAVALHALHSNGYIHNDLHQGNILVKNHKEKNDPYRLKLLDFGLAQKVTPEGVKGEWRSFAHLLTSIASKQKLSQSPKFNDLLYNPVKGLLAGRLPYSGNEIVNHPFFV